MSEQNVQNKKAALSYGMGVAQIVAGAPILLFSSIAVLVGIFLLRQSGPVYFIIELISIPIAFGGGALFSNGVRTCGLVNSYQKITSAMQYKNFIGIPELIAATGMTLVSLTTNIYVLIDMGYFPNAYVDLERKELVLSGGKRPSAELKDGDTVYLIKEKLAPSTFIAIPFVWMIYIVIRPMQSWIDFLIAGILSIIALGYFAYKSGRVRYLEEKRYKAPKTPAPVPIKTGNSDLDTLLTTAMDYVSQLNELSLNITNEKMSGPIGELLNVSRQIFAYVEKQPDKIRQIRQFMNYYLPTTIKLLTSYRELSQQPLKGDNIREAMGKIESSMDGIVKIFHNELDSLYSDKAVDITVDVDVMLAMMRQQGVSDDFPNMEA